MKGEIVIAGSRMKYLIGIDIGGTKTAYGLFTENKQLIIDRKKESDPSLEPKIFFDGVLNEIKSLLIDNNIVLSDVAGIGIGIPSYVNFKKGYIVQTGSLPLIKDFALRDYFQSRLGREISIVIGNDSQAGALAEYRYGVGRDYDSFVYCPVSTGISSAIIIEGKIFRGSYGWSGESGHMLTSDKCADNVKCGCNNSGCFNSLCSGKMIVNSVIDWIDNGNETILAELAGGKEYITCEHINIAYEMGDLLAVQALEQMARYMAMWLYNVYMVLNINCFVLSGGLLSMGDKLFGRVKQLFAKYNNINEYPVYFHEAKLGSLSGITGAIELLG